MQDEDLTPDEKSAFAALPREVAPPVDLEDRVTRAVIAGDMPPAVEPTVTEPTTSPWLTGLVRAAAAALIFFAGAAAGRATAPPVRPPAPQAAAYDERPPYLLTLYGGAPLARKTPEELFEEYSAWARELADGGHLIASARLEDDREVFGDWGWVPTERLPGGFFYIRASSRQEAEAIARESPHVRYGGAVELRGVVRR
jgi:hypothetical protein